MCSIAVTSWCTARVATLLLGLGRVAGRAWLGGWQGCRRLAPAPQGTPSGGGGKHSPKAGGATGTCFQAPPVRTHAKGKGHMLSSHFQVGGVHGNRLAPHGPREPWPRPHNIDRFGASLGAAMWTFAGPRCHLGGFPQPRGTRRCGQSGHPNYTPVVGGLCVPQAMAWFSPCHTPCHQAQHCVANPLAWTYHPVKFFVILGEENKKKYYGDIGYPPPPDT